MHLLWRVELYLKRSGIPATRFGRQTAHDPRLVFDMRKGRELGPKLRALIAAHLDEHEQGTGDETCGR